MIFILFWSLGVQIFFLQRPLTLFHGVEAYRGHIPLWLSVQLSSTALPHRLKSEITVCTTGSGQLAPTVNVDFITVEYLLLIKYQSMSIWEFFLADKATQLDWTSLLRIFTRGFANLTSGKGRGGMRGCCWTAL